MKYTFEIPDLQIVFSLNSHDSVNIDYSGQVVTHPVERGLPPSDHVIIDNTKIAVSGYTSNFTHKDKTYIFDSTGDIVIDPNFKPNTVSSTYEANKLREYLNTCWYGRLPFTFKRYEEDTAIPTYSLSNCFFNQISFKHDTSTGDGFAISLSFVQVRIVDIELQQVNTTEVNLLVADAKTVAKGSSDSSDATTVDDKELNTDQSGSTTTSSKDGDWMQEYQDNITLAINAQTQDIDAVNTDNDAKKKLVGQNIDKIEKLGHYIANPFDNPSLR